MAHETHHVNSVAEQASYWWAVFRGRDASPEEYRQFREWFMQSPERIAAYLRVARLERTLTGPALKWPDVPAGTLIRAAKAAPEEVVRLAPPAPRSGARPHRSVLNARRGWALAAALLLAVLAGWYVLLQPQRYESALGEQRSFSLKDGSRVTLNTASKIEVRLKSTHRVVRLLRGEALFEVAHDPSRPFDVVTNHTVVRAVGTQFNVYQETEQTIVTVLEGHVAVVARPALVLGAGERLLITQDGVMTREEGVNVTAATRWTRNQLIFVRRSLGEIADELNRYNRDRIEIRSPTLQSRKITGTFRANDAGSFVAYLAGIPGVSVESSRAGDHIVNYREASSP